MEHHHPFLYEPLPLAPAISQAWLFLANKIKYKLWIIHEAKIDESREKVRIEALYQLFFDRSVWEESELYSAQLM